MKLQYRLRTLMIVVTLLAMPMGYVGWQAKIVRERMASLEMAADISVPVNNRRMAAMNLGRDEKATLNAAIIARMDGHYDGRLLDDIVVLSIVGDESTIHRLKRMLSETDVIVPGKIRSAARRTIEDIRARGGQSQATVATVTTMNSVRNRN